MFEKLPGGHRGIMRSRKERAAVTSSTGQPWRGQAVRGRAGWDSLAQPAHQGVQQRQGPNTCLALEPWFSASRSCGCAGLPGHKELDQPQVHVSSDTQEGLVPMDDLTVEAGEEARREGEG